MKNTRLSSKRTIITGSSSGIGAAVAVKFAEEGAVIGLNYHRNHDGAVEILNRIQKLGAEGLLLQGDISDKEEAESIVSKFTEKFGGIDILVNNSGIGSNTPDTVTEISQEDWERVIAVNLTGSQLMSKFVLPYMIEQGNGNIVNISSIRGLLGNPNLASYSSSKGGLVILTKQMACDYAEFGVRVNCVCPGFTETEMFKGYLNKQADPEESKRRFSNMALLNRVGDPSEIACVVLFFASSASSFITGVALPVDGGYMANAIREII